MPMLLILGIVVGLVCLLAGLVTLVIVTDPGKRPVQRPLAGPKPYPPPPYAKPTDPDRPNLSLITDVEPRRMTRQETELYWRGYRAGFRAALDEEG